MLRRGVGALRPPVGPSAKAVAERTLAAVAEMKGRWLLLLPDCSINPETPDAFLHAARVALGG